MLDFWIFFFFFFSIAELIKSPFNALTQTLVSNPILSSLLFGFTAEEQQRPEVIEYLQFKEKTFLHFFDSEINFLILKVIVILFFKCFYFIYLFYHWMGQFFVLFNYYFFFTNSFLSLFNLNLLFIFILTIIILVNIISNFNWLFLIFFFSKILFFNFFFF
jgi:hypothetical protein